MNTQPFFRTLVPAFFLFFLSSALGAECVHPDYDGLEKFYIATNGDDWDDKDGWLTDCEPCGWKGIECDAAGRVVTILLRENGLTGTLPTDFGNLTELRLLAIPRNAVTGPLPNALFSLPELRDLNLAQNEFTGGLSANIAQLTELEYLRLGRNTFTGLLPADLSSCTRLKILTLEENNFTDRIPEGLGDLPDLQGVSFFNNDFSGCFPEDLSDLCGRTRASFGGNPKLTWKGDFTQLCLGGVDDVEQQGAPCDDGNPATNTDIITDDCRCGGVIDTDDTAEEGPGIVGTGATNEREVERFARNGNSPGVIPHVNARTGSFSAFPNPVRSGNSLNVRLPEEMAGAEVRLLSFTGREITRTSNVATGFSLNVPVLEAGVYLLEAISGDTRNVTRLIVQ